MNNKTKIVPIFVPHYGCPNQCVFCNQKKITGEKKIEITAKYLNEVVEEYLKTMEKDITKEIAFFGGSFTAINKEKQIELLKEAYKFKTSGKIDKIRMSTRPDAINEEILDLQKKYGVDIIELGIQSLDEDVLKKSNRGHLAEDSEKASELIKKYGFTLGHQIMPGLPGSNKQKDLETCNKSIFMKPEIVRIYPTLVIKDTELERMYNEGEYKSLNIEEASQLCAEIYASYRINNVKVIRMGLQNTENINLGRDVIAGPFHPAFRQLVEEKIYLNALMFVINKNNFNRSKIIIKANEKFYNYILGQKKRNIVEMKKRFNINDISIINTPDKNLITITDDFMNTDVILLKEIYKMFYKNINTDTSY